MLPVLWAVGFTRAEVPLTTLEVPLSVAVETAEPVGVKVVARELSSSKPSPTPVIVEGRAPGAIKIKLPIAHPWQLSVSAPGYWAAPLIWDPSSSLPIEALLLYPTGTVTGRLRVPATASPPEELELRFEPAAGRKGRSADLPTGTVQCRLYEEGASSYGDVYEEGADTYEEGVKEHEVGGSLYEEGAASSEERGGVYEVGAESYEEGAFSCEVPAGRQDIRLRGGDFSPAYRWGERIAAGESLDVGEVELRPGGAVLGWVELAPEVVADIGAEEETSLADVEVSLSVPNAEEAGRFETLERLESLELKAVTDEKGRFHLTGVPVGHYVLTAERPAGPHGGRLAPKQVPIEVKEGLEARLLGPVVLGPPTALTLVLDPATDPYGRPWTLGLTARDRSMQMQDGYQEIDLPEGGAEHRFADLAPGAYFLEVRDMDESQWFFREIEVGTEAKRLRVDLQGLRVWGTVTQAGEPLPGVLVFRNEVDPRAGKSRVGILNIRTPVALDGTFEVFLPDAQARPAEFELAGPAKTRIKLDGEPINVEPGETSAEVHVEVPGTLLRGTVVDEDGKAANGARVAASSVVGQSRIPKRSETLTDEEGAFSFHGLPEGLVVLSADLEGAESTHAQRDLSEDEAPEPVELVLRRSRTISGQVLGPAGPVPGARVFAWPQGPGESGGSVSQEVTGPDGSFQMDVTAGTVAVLVDAPGFALYVDALDVASALAAPLLFLLEAGGGSVVVEAEKVGSTRAPALFRGEVPLPLGFLPRLLPGRAGLDGAGRMRLSGLASGEWALCPVKAAMASVRAGQGRPEEGCADGFLAPGGELVLALD